MSESNRSFETNRSFLEFFNEAFNSPDTKFTALFISNDIWNSMKDNSLANNFGRRSACSGGSCSGGFENNLLASGNEMRTGDGRLALAALFLTNDNSRSENESYASSKKGTGGGDPPPVHDQQKRALIETALRKAGQPATKENVRAVHKIVEKESSWNPHAVNTWDSNARKGTPSKGLMQTIEPTFDRYSLPGHGNIFRPIDNLIAGIRYAVDRYGSLSNVPGIRSLSRGKPYRGY